MRVLLIVLLLGICSVATPTANSDLDFTVVHVSDSETDAGISALEREQIVQLLTDDEKTDWEAARAGDLRYKRVELANAGLNGLFVRSAAKADCGATGNCSTWLLRKSRTKYHLVLNGVSADAVGFQSQMTNGFKNVVASANMSVDTSAVQVFAYDGHKYVRQGCFEHTTTATKQVLCK
jgi:hypothetical protein